MNNDAFKVLENVKKKYGNSGFKQKVSPKKTSNIGMPNNADTNKICQRIRKKKITKSQFPKLTKSSRIFNGGKRRKTKRQRSR